MVKKLDILSSQPKVTHDAPPLKPSDSLDYQPVRKAPKVKLVKSKLRKNQDYAVEIDDKPVKVKPAQLTRIVSKPIAAYDEFSGPNQNDRPTRNQQLRNLIDSSVQSAPMSSYQQYKNIDIPFIRRFLMQTIPSIVVNKMMPLPDEILSELAVIAKNERGDVCDISTFLSLSAFCKLNNIEDVYADQQHQNNLIGNGFTNIYPSIDRFNTSISMHYIDVDNQMTTDDLKDEILDIGANVSALPRRNWQNKIVLVTGQRITEPYKWFGRANLEAFILRQHPGTPLDELQRDASKLLKEKIEVDTTTLEGVINLNQAATDAQLGAINATLGTLDANITGSRNDANLNAADIFNAIGQNSADTSARIDVFSNALLTKFDRADPDSIYASLDAIRTATVDTDTNMQRKLQDIINLKTEEARVARTNQSAVLEALRTIRGEMISTKNALEPLRRSLGTIETKAGEQVRLQESQKEAYVELAKDIREFNDELMRVDLLNKEGLAEALQEIKGLVKKEDSPDLTEAIMELSATIKDKKASDELIDDINKLFDDSIEMPELPEPPSKPKKQTNTDFKFKVQLRGRAGAGITKRGAADGEIALLYDEDEDGIKNTNSYRLVTIVNSSDTDVIDFKPNPTDRVVGKSMFHLIDDFTPLDRNTGKVLTLDQVPEDLIDYIKQQDVDFDRTKWDAKGKRIIFGESSSSDVDKKEGSSSGKGYTSGGAFVSTDFNLTDFEKLKTDLKSQKNIYIFTFN